MGVGAGADYRRLVMRGRARGPVPGRPDAPRLEAHARSGSRVRDDVRDGAAVAVFSLLTSVGIAVLMTLLTKVG